MTITVGWHLNLDADLELMDPDGDAPSDRRRAQTEELASRFLADANAASLGAVDHVQGAAPLRQSWCPTPRAVADVGQNLASPGLAVLRRVNHKAFGARLARTPFVWSLRDLDRVLIQMPRPVLLKRPFGFSGRGRKRIDSDLDNNARTWAAASMQQYGRGLQVEPFVTIEREFALHGWLDSRGTTLRGRPTTLRCNPDGRWSGTDPIVDLDPAELTALTTAFDHTAHALHAAGYFGPFAIDAFRTPERFHALSEINARYSMGWFVGMRNRIEEWAIRLAEDAMSGSTDRDV